MVNTSHWRPANTVALVVSVIALGVSILAWATGPGGPLAPPEPAPTLSLPQILTPPPAEVTSQALCEGLLNSSVLDFMGSSVGTPDAFDTGCHYEGGHHSKLGLLYYPGTQQFGTDYYIARADYGKVTVWHHRIDVPAIYYARADLPQGWHSLVVEWIAPDGRGDFQLRIGWRGNAQPLEPFGMVASFDGAFFWHIRPTTYLVGPAAHAAGPAPGPVDLTKGVRFSGTGNRLLKQSDPSSMSARVFGGVTLRW